MANKNLFKSTGSSTAVADTVNNAGGKAYAFTDKHAIAQIAVTNCFNGTYYADADSNLNLVKEAVKNLRKDPVFVAKVAIYSRDKAYMKDMPAYLCAVLAAWGESKLFRKVFDKVIDNGKMLRNFIQIGRSGQAGKVINMSSGAVRHAIRDWFKNRSAVNIFRASIGDSPSMRDILRMARPCPESVEKATLYAYLKGAELKDGSFITYDKNGNIKYNNSYDNLPDLVKQFEAFKKTHSGEIPDVDFRLLDSVLSNDELKALWKKQALNGGWHLVRMNLNNFAKYGVFEDSNCLNAIVSKLSNKEEIAKSRVYPYQLLMAYNASQNKVPFSVGEALQDAMEIAIDNVPSINGKIYVCVDTSGSMSSPVTGSRGTVSTNVRCVDVASLFAAAILRRNKSAEVIPFDTRVHNTNLNSRDTVLTNAKTLSSYGGGGTDCGCAIKYINDNKGKGDAVIFISDNESWVDNSYSWSRGTSLMEGWNQFKKRNPDSKLVCIDITSRNNSQVSKKKDILQVGGFGDQVFDVVSTFINGSNSTDHWVELIENISLD